MLVGVAELTENTSKGEEQPKFLAVLDARDNGLSEPEPIFSVVETNQFKYLTHLSLRLRGANDSELKRYLASRLSQSQRAMAECVSSPLYV